MKRSTDSICLSAVRVSTPVTMYTRCARVYNFNVVVRVKEHISLCSLLSCVDCTMRYSAGHSEGYIYVKGQDNVEHVIHAFRPDPISFFRDRNKHCK